MKGFLEEYGLIIVVVAVILLMLLFGKSGYAKSIQDAILGSTNHIVETGENITKKEVHVTTGDMLDIEGNKYIVLEKQGNYQALVMTVDSIGEKSFQSSIRSDGLRQDGQYINTYEGSEIDNYLENDWYKGLSNDRYIGLSAKMQNAIQLTNIKQASYARYNDPDSKQETGPSGQVYNTISRHVFLPSVSEIGKVVDLKNSDKVKAFLNRTDIWTRDSSQEYDGVAVYLNAYYGSLSRTSVNYDNGVRPAFVIDLSKVDYTEAGHVDYK